MATLIPRLGQRGSPLLKACFERVDFLATSLMAAVVTVVMAALGGYKDIKLPLDFVTFVTVLFLLLTFLSGYMLLVYVNCMSNRDGLTHQQDGLTYKQYMIHVVLVSFGGSCLICTKVILLAHINRVNALWACVLVVMPFSIYILASAEHQINDTNHIQPDTDPEEEEAIKSCCDVAYLTVGSAFPMHVCVLFVYYKNYSLRVNEHLRFDMSVTFFASVVGVFSIMVTAMPLELLPRATRSKVLLLVKLLKYFMLFLTATAAITLGHRCIGFGWRLILISLIPTLFVPFAYWFAGLVNPDHNNINEESEIPGMLTGAINTCIIVLSLVYPVHTGGKFLFVRVGIFILVSMIGGSLSLIAFPFYFFMTIQRSNVTKVFIAILMVLLITLAASFLLYIFKISF